MADNVAITAGSGTTIATDDCGAGGHTQLFKLAYSADGVATLALVDANGLETQGPGTAGAAAGGVMTVQGVASMTPVQVAQATAASLNVTVGNTSIAGTAGSPNAAVLTIQGVSGGTNQNVMPAEAGKTRVSKRVAVTASATGTAIWTPTSGWRFVLTKLWVSAKTAGDIQIFDATDSGNTVVSPIVTLNAGGGCVVEWPKDWPYRSSAVNAVLKFTTGTVITGSVYCEGWEENA